MEPLIRKHYIAAIGSFLLFLGGAVLVWRFAGGMDDREKRVVEARDRIASFELNKKVLTEESKELDVITARADALQRYIVTDDGIPDLLSGVETIAKNNNITFTIDSVQNQGSAGSKKLIINFSGDGSLAHIESFLQALLSQTYQLHFSRFNLFKEDSAPVADSSTAGKPLPQTQTPSGPLWHIEAGIEVLSY